MSEVLRHRTHNVLTSALLGAALGLVLTAVGAAVGGVAGALVTLAIFAVAVLATLATRPGVERVLARPTERPRRSRADAAAATRVVEPIWVRRSEVRAARAARRAFVR